MKNNNGLRMEPQGTPTLTCAMKKAFHLIQSLFSMSKAVSKFWISYLISHFLGFEDKTIVPDFIEYFWNVKENTSNFIIITKRFVNIMLYW